MKKSILAVVILSLVSASVFANGQSNAHNYQPGATNNSERLADIDPNYELTLPSEKEGYTMYDNQSMSDGGPTQRMSNRILPMQCMLPMKAR
ncbi:hypothetical protein [Vibrio splendidus]|uniref:hypothetical protein n=1 Tax=Vibrio splendidus TaxID=29497 RepID=UPI001F53502F|nr:hypothetical protein [Vibrio splendidus]